MGKNENKTVRKNHRDQMNGSWFKIGVPMVEWEEENEPIP